MRCDLCKEKNCDNGSPCFTKESEALYQDTVELEMMRAASSIEAEYYGELNRIQEIILFAKRLGYKKIGLAFCIGLSEEAARVCRDRPHSLENVDVHFLRHQADQGTRGAIILAGVEACRGDLASGRRDDPAHGVDQCRLARAIGA